MPTYEFRCPTGHEFEKFYRSMSAAPREVPCPTCGKIAERQMSAGAGLVFKGSGFYITDYGKDGKKPAAEGKSDSGQSESASTQSDSKPSAEVKPAAPAKTEPKPPPAPKTGGKGSSGGAKSSE
jgi:putative FmdB family regulatory protein